MRKAASKLRWQGRSVVAAIGLAAGIAALLLLSSSAKADPPPFPVYASVDVDDTDCLVNSDIERTFGIDDDPWPAAMYQNHVSFVPGEWYVATADDAPIGAVVGQHERVASLGIINSPCTSVLGLSLTLMNCTVDKFYTVDFDGQFGNPSGVHDGCTKWPMFLDDLFPDLTPRARMAGFTFLSGVDLSLNVLIFEPGTPLPLIDLPSFSSDRGYIAVFVFNDPGAPLTPDLITNSCPPVGTATTVYGLTHDHPNTVEDESDYAWRTNPAYGGTYPFYDYANSIRDADGDGIDNELDTCPHIPCSDPGQCDPKSPAGDDDGDGLDNDCDPLPDMPPEKFSLDGDAYPNRQDNCPLVWNDDQLDSDFDGIGDVCDQDDWNDDGDLDDPGEPTGFDPDTPDGDMAEAWLEADVEIYGPSCVVPGADTDGDGFDDAHEIALGSDHEDADSTPEDTSIADSCTDEEDNDLDGYIDDVDGGCGDDTDGDGVSDDGEDDLGSDPEDADSTPEDVSVAGSCTDGVDNDGDGDIDAADAGCAEAPVTPTPTETVEPEATPTPTPTVQVEICAPVFPGTYSGLVRIDGQPAAAGYEVTASIDGMDWGSAIVSGGRYAVDIPDHMPSSEPCFEAGTITFTLNGMTCTPTADWASGLHTVDLSCAPAAPPVTPTEPATPEVTPEPTPVAPPDSGAGGLSGSSSGLPLWALALTSRAGLTIVTGLGTLVAVKRR